MQKTKTLIAMILLIILTLPMLIQVSQIQPAKAANLDVPVYLKISAEPNPVGLGQTEFISLFFTKPIPNVAGQYYTGLTFNLVMPDGTNKTYGPYTADTTGGVGGIHFVPTVVGNYTVQGFYPGQNITTGDHLIATLSLPDTFTVQQDPITSYATPPLPTEYWSRPIYATNYNWAQLGGNWWGLGKPSFTDTGGYDAIGNNFNPYSERQTQATSCGLSQQLLEANQVYQLAAIKKANTHQHQSSTDNSNPLSLTASSTTKYIPTYQQPSLAPAEPPVETQ